MGLRHALRATLAYAIAAGAMAAGPAHAQALGFRYWAELSAYRPSVDARASVSRPGSPGTVLDFENDLGLNKHEVLPDVVVGARFLKRWSVVGEFFPLDRNGSRTVTRDLVFDGVTYPRSVSIDSQLRSDVYRVSVGYNFVQTPRAELGVSLGLHATDFKVELDGDALTASGSTGRQAHAKNFLAPLPTVGVVGAYEVAPRVILSARADYMSLKYKDYDGSILNAQASIGYRLTDHLEIGAAYRYVDYGLDVEKDSYTAKVDYHFNGPAIYVRAGFR
jgi:hypothetical protein